MYKTLEGQRDITWPGKIKYFALSSGTTGSPSKRIPVSNQMIHSFQKASVKQLATLHELNLPETFYQTQILTVGGSTELVSVGKHKEGDLSGILRKYAPILAAPFTKPEKKISKYADWNEKLDLMVKKAHEWDIGIIAGVPSWCILLMEKIIEYYKVKSIHEIWPNLSVYVHGGVFMSPYEKRLNRTLGRKIHLMETYLASEGYFAYQKSVNNIGMQLLLGTGVFFEFIPFNADYFNQEGELRNRHVAFSIDEVQPKMDYAIVVSTNAGLWRYLIGDLVRFTDIEKREIVLTGRIKQFLSLCGEHLSLDNINNAVDFVCKQEKIEITEFTIVANEENLIHHWFLGIEKEIDATDIISKIDKQICVLNDDYKCSRKINLKAPLVTILPTTIFYDFMESNQKLGAQHKFPRVLSENQSKAWLDYLSKTVSEDILLVEA